MNLLDHIKSNKRQQYTAWFQVGQKGLKSNSTYNLTNLRPTTREWVHLVGRGHFWSRDKDCGHTILSALPKTSCCMQTSWLYVLYNRSYGHSKLYFAGMYFYFRPCFLLWPWPWPDNRHMRTWPVFPGDTSDVQIWTSYVKAFESYLLTDRHTGPKLYTTPFRGWSNTTKLVVK